MQVLIVRDTETTDEQVAELVDTLNMLGVRYAVVSADLPDLSEPKYKNVSMSCRALPAPKPTWEDVCMVVSGGSR